MDDECLDGYTLLRNDILQSKRLKKFEMDYIIVAVNAYRKYEDSIYMHANSALQSGGTLEELNSVINMIIKLKPSSGKEIREQWIDVSKKMNVNSFDSSYSYNSSLTEEMELLIICTTLIATLQSDLTTSYLKRYMCLDFDKRKLDEGILACLLTAGIPVIFEYTKALENIES